VLIVCFVKVPSRRPVHGRARSIAPLAGLLLAGCAALTATSPHSPQDAESPEARVADLSERCEQGFVTACRDLGRASLLGAGVPPDDRMAAALLIKGCEMGEAGSCSDLAVLSTLGRGVAQDDARAGALARRSCGAGFSLGCSNVGTLTFEGVNRLVLRPEEAGDAGAKTVQYFRGACDAAVPEGCLNLGAAMERGDLIAKDRAGAGAAYRRACDAGLSVACHRLVHMAMDGNTGPPDPEVKAFAARVCKAGIAVDCQLAGEPITPPGPRTPSPRLLIEERSFALGIPGAGGFHPADLTPARSGPRRSREEVRRPTRQLLAQVPAALRPRLDLDRPIREGTDAPDQAVDLLLSLRRQQLGTCVEQDERRGAPLATLVGLFLIESAGRPEELRVAAEPPNPEVERCARELISGWEFPVPDGGLSGLHLVRLDFEPAPPGPPPAYPVVGGLRPALEVPGCLERSVKLPSEARGGTASVTIKLAVDTRGQPILVHPVSLAPEPVVSAVVAAVRSCAWRPGLDEQGRKGVFWLTLPVRIAPR
jgi:TPR repeat protein